MKILFYIFLFFCFFPYIQFFPLGTDTQPYAVILGVIVVLSMSNGHLHINGKLSYLLVVMIWAILVFGFSNMDFNSLRSLISYISLFVITYASWLMLKKYNGFSYTFYCACVIIWFAVGLIQMLIYPQFMAFILPRGDTEAILDTGRGVLALAPEATSYGLICLFFIMVGILNFLSHKSLKWIIVLNIIQLFLFSRSTLAIFAMTIAVMVYLISLCLSTKNRIKYGLLLIVSLFLLYVIVPLILQKFADANVRFIRMLSNVWTSPKTFVVDDASVNERFNHIYISIKGFFCDFGLPHGFGNFYDYYVQELKNPEWVDMVNYFTILVPHGTRIMSGFGGMLYELGGLSLLVFIVIYKSFHTLSLRNAYARFCMYLYCIILLNAIQFNAGIVCFVLGNVIFLSGKQSISIKFQKV